MLKDQTESVKFQILIYTFSNDIHITKNQLNLLTLLAIKGINKETLNEALKLKIFKSKYSLGNALSFLTKEGLIVSEKNKKIINPKLELITNELIVGNIKVINLEK